MLKKILAGIFCVATVLTMTSCSDNQTTLNNPSKSAESNIGDVTLENGDKYAIIKIKDYGEITVKLFPEAAPKGVENFEKLVNDGFYSGKTLHRVIKNFMMQGGAADSEATIEQFGIETNYNLRHFYGALCYANALGQNSTQFYIVNSKESADVSEYDPSAMEYYASTYDTMANQSEEGSNAQKYYAYQAEFYRNAKKFVENNTDEIIKKYKDVGGAPSLDGNYTVFGQTIDGFDVIDKIALVEVEANTDMNDEVSKPVTEIIIESVTVAVYGE